MNRALDLLHERRRITLVIHGAARGADTLAANWAASRGVEAKAYPADWDRHGKAAGHIRNAAMLTEEPDGVVAFPGGRGTSDMRRKAEAAAVKAWIPFGGVA